MEVFFTARARPAAPEAFDVRISLIFLANYFFISFWSLLHSLTLLKTYFSGAMESTSIATSQNESTASIEARHVLDLVLDLGPCVRIRAFVPTSKWFQYLDRKELKYCWYPVWNISKEKVIFTNLQTTKYCTCTTLSENRPKSRLFKRFLCYVQIWNRAFKSANLRICELQNFCGLPTFY